uniref:Uncharacterized protein n=1 Tax=Desertifilum tharense IPPAS B-1220 TaxID=1781255 RepID=A0ACD5GQD5_9CYAN
MVLAAASSAALTSSSSPLSWGEKYLEAQWNGFSAGLFTYALTQYLWTATPATTLHISLSRATGVVEQLAGPHQLPSLAVPRCERAIAPRLLSGTECPLGRGRGDRGG